MEIANFGGGRIVLRGIFLASIFLAYVEPKLSFLLLRGKILQCSPYLHGALRAPVSRHGLLAQCHGLKRQVTSDVQINVWDCRRDMLGSW